MRQALIAVGVFAVLLGVVLATRERGNVNVGVPKLALPALDPAKITAIEVSGAQTVRLEQQPEGWQVAGASKALHPADGAQVSALRTELAQLKPGDFITDRAQRLPELELDDAKGLALKVFTGGATPALELVFGKPGKLGGTYLRQPKGEAVFLTNSSAPSLLRRPANDWRKRIFFPASLAQLGKLKVTVGAGAPVELQAKPDGTWALVSAVPAGFRFDPAAAGRLASALVGSAATDFPEGAASAPLTAATIEAELTAGKTVVLRLGEPNPAGGVPAQVDGDPQVYVVSAEQAGQLRKRLEELRDTHLVAAFDPARAQKLVIQAGGKKTVLARDAAAWKLLEPKQPPPGFELDPAQVEGQLAALRSLAAARVEEVSEAKAGFGKPTATLELTIDGAPAQTVKFGAALPSGQLYVKGSADGLVYAIDAAERTRWEAGVELFKKQPAPPPRIQGLQDLPPELRQQLEAQLRQQQR